jgi:opacity protein-like surface antigen
MRHLVINFFLLTNLVVLFDSAKSQTYLGAGIGTFNVPGAINKFRGFGPTIKFEYLPAQAALYIDLSRFSKKIDEGSVDLHDNSGNVVGKADAQTTFSYLYSQLGLKVFFAAAHEKKLLPYACGGTALIFANTTTSYASNVYTVDDDKMNRFIFGFHLGVGLQYDLKSVMLELRGNLDLDTKPLVNDGSSDVSNVLTNTRLSVLIPL